MNRKTARRFVWILVGLVLSAALAQAQYRTSIQGVVTDPTGATTTYTLALSNGVGSGNMRGGI